MRHLSSSRVVVEESRFGEGDERSVPTKGGDADMSEANRTRKGEKAKMRSLVRLDNLDRGRGCRSSTRPQKYGTWAAVVGLGTIDRYNKDLGLSYGSLENDLNKYSELVS